MATKFTNISYDQLVDLVVDSVIVSAQDAPFFKSDLFKNPNAQAVRDLMYTYIANREMDFLNTEINSIAAMDDADKGTDTMKETLEMYQRRLEELNKLEKHQAVEQNAL